MIRILAPLTASLLPLGIAVAAVKLPATDGEEAVKFPRCEIHVSHEEEGLVLEGLVFTRNQISGSYRLRVIKTAGGGSADIVQSGEFRAESGSSSSLGLVSLSQGTYRATLEIEWDNGEAQCSERVRSEGRALYQERLP